MPSPFPGMDPYLESPRRWRGVHASLIAICAELLNQSLPDGFAAEIDERLYVVDPARDVFPDVAVVVRPTARGTALLESPTADPSIPLLASSEEVRETFVTIFDRRQGGERVVTSVEILSPKNKRAGEGGEQYRTKQRQVLAAGIHLLEVDLLRAGTHTILAPKEEVEERCGAWDYLVCLHRMGEGALFHLWPVTLRQRLPRVSVPLADDVPDDTLDLQQAIDLLYARGRHAIDYTLDPDPPLHGQTDSWADSLLKAKNLR
jgi:hypothetical protein